MSDNQGANPSETPGEQPEGSLEDTIAQLQAVVPHIATMQATCRGRRTLTAETKEGVLQAINDIFESWLQHTSKYGEEYEQKLQTYIQMKQENDHREQNLASLYQQLAQVQEISKRKIQSVIAAFGGQQVLNPTSS